MATKVQKRNRNRVHNTCIFCSKVLNSRQNYQRHLQAHNNENPYFCKFCSKELSSQNSLSYHERFQCHLGTAEAPRLKCNKCPKLFKTKQSLQIHERVHGNEFTHVCDTCGKGFKWKNALTGHVERIHEKKTQFTCSFCPLKLLYLRDLIAHLRTHTGEKTYKCSTCSRTFLLKSNLRSHELTHINIPVEDWLPCEQCSKRFKSKSHLSDHLRRFHGRSKFDCTVCQNFFKNSRDLQRHIKIHTNENKSKCNICNKIFANDRTRKRHEKIHFAKLYKCNLCSQEFHRPESLKTHVKHHENEELASCLFCEKLCATESVLFSHLLTCLQERPFICKHCGLEYSRSAALEIHARKLH